MAHIDKQRGKYRARFADPLGTVQSRTFARKAEAERKILTNPCERVDPPRVPKREMTFLDWDEAIRLADDHSAEFAASLERVKHHHLTADDHPSSSWTAARSHTIAHSSS